MSIRNSNVSSARTPKAVEKTRWIVAQIGAREHYALARCAHSNGGLSCFYTDVWCRFGQTTLARGPRVCRALAGRWHDDLRYAQVRTLGLRVAIGAALAGRAGDSRQLHFNFIKAGRRFAQILAAQLARCPLEAGRDVFIGYNTASLETLRALRERGISTLLAQIDPARTEAALVAGEHRRWPGWQPHSGAGIPEEYWARMHDEWCEADAVVVNSGWSKRALETQGVPADKIHIVPLAYERPRGSASGRIRRAASRRGPLMVLFLGQVNLRKGIPYLLATAARLPNDIEVTVAGPIAIAADKIAAAPANVRFVGTVARADIGKYMDQADVFVLPTVSDGFAITQLEAMAFGLPVVATSSCAQVVTDKMDGRVVPPGDVDALTGALADIAGDAGALEAYSTAALRTVDRYSLARVAVELDMVAQQVVASSGLDGK